MPRVHLHSVEIEGATLSAQIVIYPVERCVNSSEDYPCHFCGKRRHEVALLGLSLYSDSAEMTVRACGPCLAEHGVREILPEEIT